VDHRELKEEGNAGSMGRSALTPFSRRIGRSGRQAIYRLRMRMIRVGTVAAVLLLALSAACSDDNEGQAAAESFVCFALQPDDWSAASAFQQRFIEDGEYSQPGMSGFQLTISGSEIQLVVELDEGADREAWIMNLPASISNAPELVATSTVDRECAAG
jgi:hypothetical protein